jgi:hypothetical protein
MYRDILFWLALVLLRSHEGVKSAFVYESENSERIVKKHILKDTTLKIDKFTAKILTSSLKP